MFLHRAFSICDTLRIPDFWAHNSYGFPLERDLLQCGCNNAPSGDKKINLPSDILADFIY